jgi:hypothetical protein
VPEAVQAGSKEAQTAPQAWMCDVHEIAENGFFWYNKHAEDAARIGDVHKIRDSFL